MANIVAVHGGYDGGWSWTAIASLLRNQGHHVFTPTLTGCGERVHLASPEINLSTHVCDVSNVLTSEGLDDVVLVGHSYGGLVIAAATCDEAVASRVGQLIYLDAIVPVSGQSMWETLGSDVAEAMLNAAAQQGDGWFIPASFDEPRNTPFLIRPLGDVVGELDQSIPSTYVAFTAKPKDDPYRELFASIVDRIRRSENCECLEASLPHFPMLESPELVADLLCQVISDSGDVRKTV